MVKRQGFLALLVLAVPVGLLLVHCRPGSPGVRPTPTKARVVPSLPSATPLAFVTETPSPTPQASATPTAAPTSPPPPSPTAALSTDTPAPSDTPIPPLATDRPPPSDTPRPASPTPTVQPPTQPPPTATATASSQPPLPPQQGGEWDMEAGFVPGVSPLGEDCPGWAVAAGWQAFLAPGEPASSCLNENKNLTTRTAASTRKRAQGVFFCFHTPYCRRDELYIEPDERGRILHRRLDYRRHYRILNSRAGLKSALRNQWKRSLDICTVYEKGAVYECCRYSGDPDLCQHCGYLSYAEIDQTLKMKPSAIYNALKHF